MTAFETYKQNSVHSYLHIMQKKDIRAMTDLFKEIFSFLFHS